MASSRLPNGTSASKTQQKPDWLTGAGAPPSGGSSRTREHGSFGGPSHLSRITPTGECHQEPIQQSFFIRDGSRVRPLERVPCNHEVAVVTARPSTPVHQRRQPEHTGDAGAPRRSRIKTPIVNHTAENERLIKSLPSHLQSLIRNHFGSSMELQVYALNRIVQGPICHVETNDGDQKGTITCTLCPSPRAFPQANALRKFAHHFRTVHCGIKRSFKCIVPSCDKVFSHRHDMKRHFNTAHPTIPYSDFSTEDVQDNILEPVAASSVAGPSHSHTVDDVPPNLTRNIASPPSHVPTSAFSKLAKESSPRKGTNVADLRSPAPKLSHQVNPYRQQNLASSHLGRNQHTTGDVNLSGRFQSATSGPTMTDDDGFGRGYTGPSTSLQTGYMMSGSQLWMNRSLSSGRSSMPQGERYGGSSHTSVPGVDGAIAYLHSYGQTIPLSSSSQSGGVPSGLPGGTLQQIQSRQHAHSAIVSQMVNPGYTMDTMATGVPGSLPQFHSNFIPTEGSRQSARFLAATGAPTHWQDADVASMNAHYAQYQHGQGGYDGMRDLGQGMSSQYSGLRHMQPVRRGSTRPTLPHHTETTLQHQYPLQHQTDNLHNHGQQATPPSWGHPQNSTDTTSRSPSRMPLQSQGYPGQYGQTPTRNAKGPGHLGDRVSQNQGALKRAVGRSLSSCLGLMRRMVAISGASQSAIPVSLAPPWERKRHSLLFLTREGEVHNIHLWTWALRKWPLCGLLASVC